MVERQSNLQDQFLNAVRRAKLPVSIFVTKGVKLQGVIPWFDSFSVLLRREGRDQLVYKHSISTIMPAGDLCDFVPEVRELGPDTPLQERFLSSVANARAPITMFLSNGVMLQGEIAGFDQFSLILSRGRTMQMVYKHAISTIQPDVAVDLGWEGAKELQSELVG